MRRHDVGEADRLITLYTPTVGKLRTVAKGVRRPASRKAGHLELFIHSNLLIARGKNLDVITQAETVHAFRSLREDLDRITYAHYVVELLDRFAVENEGNPALFELLIDTLHRLCEADDLALVTRFYELGILALEGYRPQFFYCLECGDEIKPVINYLSPNQGGVLCPRCGEGLIGPPGAARHVRPLSVNTLKVLRYLQTHAYEECRRLRLKPVTHRDMEAAMHHYITYILERNLKSIEFMRRLRQERI
jgi:DNA repair protein RecO (recombination protein O)